MFEGQFGVAYYYVFVTFSLIIITSDSPRLRKGVMLTLKCFSIILCMIIIYTYKHLNHCIYFKKKNINIRGILLKRSKHTYGQTAVSDFVLSYVMIML
jgi:hypothetical protein